MSAVLDALAELRATIAALPPRPVRFEMSTTTLELLPRPVAGHPIGDGAWDAIPVHMADDVPHGCVRAVMPDGTTTLIDPTKRV